MEGTPLHGESNANRIYVLPTAVRSTVEVKARDIDATANFGFAAINIINGTGTALVNAALQLKDPGVGVAADGKIYLSEVAEALKTSGPSAKIDWSKFLASTDVSGTLNMILPVTLAGSAVPGLSLSGSPKLLVSWTNITLPDTLTITSADMASLSSLENLSTAGLNGEVSLSRLGEHGIRRVVGLADLRIKLSSGKLFDLSIGDAKTVSDLMNRFVKVSSGDLKLEINANADGFRLVDLSGGTGSFTLSSLNNSFAINDLGFAGKTAVDGGIVGNSIFSMGVLGALESLADIINRIEGGNALLTQPLPIIDTSLQDLLGAARGFSDSLDAITQSPAQSIQQLEPFLETSLGLAPSDVTLLLDGNVLRIGLRKRAASTTNQSLSVDLGAAVPGDLVDSKATAKLRTTAGSDLLLSLGIDLSNPTKPRAFLDTDPTKTKWSLTARVDNTTPVAFNTSLGPIGVFVAGGSVRVGSTAAGTAPATYTITLPSGTAGRVYLDQFSLSGITTAVNGAAETTLPLFSPLVTQPLGGATTDGNADGVADNAVRLRVSDLGNVIGTTSLVTPPSLVSILNGTDIASNLGAFLGGWDGLLTFLDKAIESKILSLDLPIIGKNLKNVSNFVTDLRNAIRTNPDISTPNKLVRANAATFLRQELFESLNGIGLLMDRNGSGTVTIDDIGLVTSAGDTRFDMRLGGLINVGNNLNFDLGLPGLGLKLDSATVGMTASFQFDVGVGVSKANGAYFAFNPAKTDDLSLKVRAQLNLNPTTPTASLGFFKFDVTNRNSVFDGTFAVDLKVPATGIVRLSSLGSASGLSVDSKLSGSVNVGLDLTTNVSTSGKIPKLRTSLDIGWNFGGGSTADGGKALGAPTISYSGVQISLGSFLGDFLKPIVTEIQKVTKPIEPILNVLTTPIPVISDLAGPVNLLTLARLFGYDKAADFIQSVSDINNLSNQLASLVANDGWLDLGSFTLDGRQAKSISSLGPSARKKWLPKPMNRFKFKSIPVLVPKQDQLLMPPHQCAVGALRFRSWKIPQALSVCYSDAM